MGFPPCEAMLNENDWSASCDFSIVSNEDGVLPNRVAIRSAQINATLNFIGELEG
jgi:hypothetical protein